MLPNNFYEVMNRYSNNKIINNKDKSTLEKLVQWRLCKIGGNYAGLTPKGLNCFQEERRLREPISRFFRTIKEIFGK